MSGYRLTAAANADLADIAQTIRRASAPAADRLLDRFEAGFDLLTSQPQIGRTCDDLPPGGRLLIVGNYLVFYLVQDEEVLIVRILHGARLLNPDLFRE